MRQPHSSTILWLMVIALGVVVDKEGWQVPREWNPFAPLVVEDPITPVTQWKLGRLKDDRAACRAALESAPADALDYMPLADYTPVDGCPLENVIRVRGGEVGFNTSFVASCPLAVAWVLFERHRLQPAAEDYFGERVTAIQHYGSFACRNIYHREHARRSDHATAEALDVAAFRLADGQRISVLEDWGNDDAAGEFLREAQSGACGLFGTVLGPEYNAAHANHFHFGMRGISFCR